MALSVGQLLHNNRYRIDEILGEGGMGVVYKAWDTILDIPVAIKENLDSSQEAHKQFIKEARFLARLSHPNLPKVTDYFFIQDQGQYLVMSYVVGQDLQEIIKQEGSIQEERAMPWITQVCGALKYLHSQQKPIIHRDIKPGNIRIQTDGNAMLVDFGIAKIYDPELSTTVGARRISPGYSPPEQYGQGDTNQRSDIYALGATMYHLFTGEKLPESLALLTGAASPPKRPREINDSISPKVESLVMRSIQLDQEDRFQSVDELLEKFKEESDFESKKAGSMVIAGKNGEDRAASQLDPYDSQEPSIEGRDDRPPRTAWKVWAISLGIISVLTLAGLVLYWLISGIGPPSNADLTSTAQAQLISKSTIEPSDTPVPSNTPTDTPSPSATNTSTPTNSTTPSPNHSSTPSDTPTPTGIPGMVFIPAGTFQMGSDSLSALMECQEFRQDCERWWFDNEEPVHDVYVDTFYIDIYEVTNAQYNECVDSGYCDITSCSETDNPERANNPVICINWYEASDYCQWVGKRLPTEAEWEKAARGGLEGMQYPWGNGRPVCETGAQNGAQNKTCAGETREVGSFGPNGYGIYDMAGNVREWVNSLYMVYPYNADDGRDDGDRAGERVQRGGAWVDWSYNLRVADRFFTRPGETSFFLGFRCAYSP